MIAFYYYYYYYYYYTLSCHLLQSFWANFSHPFTMCCTLSIFFHIICTTGFHWSYLCIASHSLLWWPVSLQHITKLLYRSSNHFWITIVKIYLYQLSLAFPWWTVRAFSFHTSFVSVLGIPSVLIVSAAATPLIRFSSELVT